MIGRCLLVLLLLAESASAYRISRFPPCHCAVDRVLPRPGATDVPINTRLWTIPARGADAVNFRPSLFTLAPSTSYAIDVPSTNFTTGTMRDDAPPTRPVVFSVSITDVDEGTSGRGTVAVLGVWARFDADTSIVRITLDDGRGKVAYYTTPDTLGVCDPGIQIATRGVVHVEVTAIDLAGNESVPASADAATAVDPSARATCERPEEHYTHCGSPLVFLVYFAPILGVFGFVVLLLVIAARSSRRRAHAEAEPFSIASAVYLTRTLRLRAHIGLASIAVVTAVAAVDDTVAGVALGGSPILLAIAIAALVLWVQTTRFGRVLGLDGVTAEVQGDRVTVVADGKVAFLRASPKLVEKAKRNALPQARL